MAVSETGLLTPPPPNVGLCIHLSSLGLVVFTMPLRSPSL